MALQRNDVLIVAGTGTSAAISRTPTTASWTSLLEDGIYAILNFNDDEADLLERRLANANTPTKLAQLADSIRTELGSSFDRWFRGATDATPNNPELALALAKLHSPILTTNYDTLLEQILKRGSVSWTDVNGMLDVIRGQSDSIGHMHGVGTDPPNAIFSHVDYAKIRSSLDAQNLQYGAFTLKTFLFVGAGGTLSDGNIGPMAEQFADTFFTPTATHFRLCRNSEVDAANSYRGVIDVGYGDSHADLVPFLEGLAKRVERPRHVKEQEKALARIARAAQETSLVPFTASETSLELKAFTVPPVLLPMTQNEFSNLTIRERGSHKPKRLELDELITDGATIILAGDPGSGVSTALAWMATNASEALDAFPVWIDDPFKKGRADPIAFELETSRRYRDTADNEDPLDLLCIDNLKAINSPRFKRIISDTARANVQMTLIGAVEQDAPTIASALQEEGAEKVRVVYLGRFGEEETLVLADLLTGRDAAQLAQTALATVVENHLPRTPFTLAVLIELLSQGVSPSDGDSETWLLGKYLDHLLRDEYFSGEHPDELTVHNKRALLMVIASRFVRELRDEADAAEVERWVQTSIDEFAWPYRAHYVMQDFIRRHVLLKTQDNRVRFRRSAYLELLAGEYANDDPEFRQHILSSPMQLASIVCSYVASNRKDRVALEVAEMQLERIELTQVTASSFAPVRQIAMQEDALRDPSETESSEQSDRYGIVETSDLDQHYELPPDVDPPAFLSIGFEELTPARQAMRIVDFASKILRDSEQLTDQPLKRRIMGKLLIAWVKFIDHFERELSESSVDFAFPEEEGEGEIDDTSLRELFVRLTPLFLAFSGLQFCLASPRVELLLIRSDVSEEELGEEGTLVRLLALISLDGSVWIDELESLPVTAGKTFFGAYFISAIAQQAYIEDDSLNDIQRDKLLKFIRKCAEAKFKFSSSAHKNIELDQMSRSLQHARTRFRTKVRTIERKG